MVELDDATRALVVRLSQSLLRAGQRLVTAESCTGGSLSALLTELPGSSQWFERGYVTYANAAKIECLGVHAALLQTEGTVSEAVALAMARGAVANSHAQVGAAITGVAGPDGGSAEKPVGTVCFAWVRVADVHRSARVLLSGDRGAIRRQSRELALRGLLDLFPSSRSDKY